MRKNRYKIEKTRREKERMIAKSEYNNIFEKNRDKKILVVLHLYYMESWKEIKEYLKNLESYNYHLIVTVIENHYDSTILKDISNYKKDVEIKKFKNNGWDIAPFCHVLDEVQLECYDIVFKLQSKSTNKKLMFLYDQCFEKRDWFLELYEGILGAKEVHRTIDVLSEDNEYGLVAASNLIVNDPIHRVSMVNKKAKEYGFTVPENYKYVAGSCFAIRAKLLKNIQKAHFNPDVFKYEGPHKGMSMAHIIERVMCFDIENQGYTYFGNDVLIKRRRILEKKAKKFRKYSSLRLLEDKRIKFDDEWFYWQLDHKQIKSYEFKKVKLENILFRSHDGRYVHLEECSPYQYLLGNKKIYQDYCEFHHKNNLPYMTLERFDNLINSISENGYDENSKIILWDNNIINDGQHRACILRYLYGKDYEVEALILHKPWKKRLVTWLRIYLPKNLVNFILKIRK